MIDSGVDIVVGVKGDLLAKILNRVAACELSQYNLSIMNVEFTQGGTPGTVHLTVGLGMMGALFAEVVYSVTVGVASGRLTVKVEEETVPEFLREPLQSITDGSPYEMDLDDLTGFVTVKELSVKAVSDSGLLLLGVELKKGQGADWNRFHNTYTAGDLLRDSDLWGVYAQKYIIGKVIREVLSSVLAEGSMDNVDGVEVTNIEWPGDRIEVSLRGTYRGCRLFRDIDFWTKAAVTFPIEGSKLFAEARLHDTWLPEEDAIQMGICSLSSGDIIGSLLTGFVYLFAKLLMDWINMEDEVIRKEIIKIRFPEVDSLKIHSAYATSTGVAVRGGGPSEVGTSQLYVRNGKIELTKSIKVPLGYVGHPYGAIYKRTLVDNHGQASLFICGGEIEHHFNTMRGNFSLMSTDQEGGLGPHQSFKLDEKMILLPVEGVYDKYSRTYLKMCFNPTDLTEYDTTYEATLVLHTIKAVADSLGQVEYVPAEERIDVTARYSWYNMDMHRIEPHFLIDKATLLLDALVDDLMRDVFEREPWIDIRFPEGTIKEAEIFTQDPWVSSLKVTDANDVTVAESMGALPYKHVTFVMPEGTAFNLMTEGQDDEPLEPLTGHPRRAAVRTLLTVVGYVYIPVHRIQLDKPVKDMRLQCGKLYIEQNRELLIYDLTVAGDPVLVDRVGVRGPLSFSVLPESVQRQSGEVMGFSASGAFFHGAKSTQAQPLRVPSREKVSIPGVESPFKAEVKGSQWILYGRDGFTLNRVDESGSLEPWAGLTVSRKVYDGAVKGEAVFLATEDGVEVYDASRSGTPKQLATYKTSEPIKRITVKAPNIHAERSQDVLLLTYTQLGKLTPVGSYSRKYRNPRSITTRDQRIEVAGDGKSIIIYRKQTLPPAVANYREKQTLRPGKEL